MVANLYLAECAMCGGKVKKTEPQLMICDGCLEGLGKEAVADFLVKDDLEVETPTPEDPDAPTNYPPGSKGKIRVMSARYRLGRKIFHPFDARYLGDPRPRRWAKLMRV